MIDGKAVPTATAEELKRRRGKRRRRPTAGSARHRGRKKRKRKKGDKRKNGRAADILRTLRRRLNQVSATGPGTKGKRKRLADIISYIDKRVDMMNYDELRAADLEIGSGAVEGAVKYTIARRCDHGGMRWIKERAEAVLQLRCIDVNGDWDRFIETVHDRHRECALDTGERVRLEQKEPAQLPVASDDLTHTQELKAA